MTRKKGFYSCYELRPWTVIFNCGGYTPKKILKSLKLGPRQIKVKRKGQRKNISARLPEGWLVSRNSNLESPQAVAALHQP